MSDDLKKMSEDIATILTHTEYTKASIEKFDKHMERSNNRITTLETNQRWIKGGLIGSVATVFSVAISHLKDKIW